LVDNYILMLNKLTKTYLSATIPVVNVTGVIHPQLYSSQHTELKK